MKFEFVEGSVFHKYTQLVFGPTWRPGPLTAGVYRPVITAAAKSGINRYGEVEGLPVYGAAAWKADTQRDTAGRRYVGSRSVRDSLPGQGPMVSVPGRSDIYDPGSNPGMPSQGSVWPAPPNQ